MRIEVDRGAVCAALAAVVAGDAPWLEAWRLDPGGLFLALAGGWAEIWGHPDLGQVVTLTPLGAARLEVELDERWVPIGPDWSEEPFWAGAGEARNRTMGPPPRPGMRPLPPWLDVADPGPGPEGLAIAAEEEAARRVLVDELGAPLLLWGMEIPLGRPGGKGRRAG